MILIRECSVNESRSRMGELNTQHWDEIAIHKDSQSLEIDWELYEKAEKINAFLAIIAEDVDCKADKTKVIGYAGFFLMNHLHSKSLRCAQNNVIFLTKDRRKGGLAKRIITESEIILKAKGIQKVQWEVQVNKDFSGLLEHVGHTLEGKIYGRML